MGSDGKGDDTDAAASSGSPDSATVTKPEGPTVADPTHTTTEPTPTGRGHPAIGRNPPCSGRRGSAGKFEGRAEGQIGNRRKAPVEPAFVAVDESAPISDEFSAAAEITESNPTPGAADEAAPSALVA